MRVILCQGVDKLGKSGDIITVKDGYARNFLIPKGLAKIATPYNLKLIEDEKKSGKLREAKQKKEAEALAERMAAVSCTISREAQDDGKLFGSITEADIAAAYEAEGIFLDKKAVLLEEPIKEVGVYRIPIRVHPEVTQEVKLWVVKE